MKPILRQGKKGPEVKKLQRALILAGVLEKGQDDGDFGPRTKKAVEAFQEVSGCQLIDGIVGSETYGALERYMPAPMAAMTPPAPPSVPKPVEPAVPAPELPEPVAPNAQTASDPVAFARQFLGEEAIIKNGRFYGPIMTRLGVDQKWCGTFAEYVYRNTSPGLFTKSDLASDQRGIGYARAANFKAAGERHGAYRPYSASNGFGNYIPKPNDTIYFKNPSHVGIVTKYDQTTGAITYISGNLIGDYDNNPATPDTSRVFEETLYPDQFSEAGVNGVVDVAALVAAAKGLSRVASLSPQTVQEPHAEKMAGYTPPVPVTVALQPAFG